MMGIWNTIHARRFVLPIGILLLPILFLLFSSSAHAAPVVGFNAGRIIDDAVFTNKNSMSAADIQNFLDREGAKCVNGEAPCLKNFSEGGRSAAQIIYDTAQQYTINPQTLIVVLQKETGLVTVSQPGAWRYRTAMGYGCPDTAACDSQYYGFTNQMRWAATMYHAIMTDSPTWYTPYNLGNNNIQWNPQASCGSSVVNIENRATKALYNYTPYRPNQAALNAGYGTGDSCSSYGNRNFYLYFRDWFGATTDSRLLYRIIQGEGTPEVYMQTVAGKYYVPSYSLLAEWGFDSSDVESVTQSYLANLPTKSTLSNSLTDGVGNLFVIEGGNAHQVTSSTMTANWNVDTGSMVESLGLSYILNRAEPLGRFMSLAGGDGSVWLVDGTKRHQVDPSLLYAWGYYPGIRNVVSSNLFSRYTAADSATQYASSNGGSSAWLIEASTKRPFKDTATKNGYVGASAITNVGQPALDLLGNGQSLTRFGYNTSNGQWFMIDRGTKYYISKAELASLWGKSPAEPITPLLSDTLSRLTNGGNLSYTGRSVSSAAYWLIAKNKHYIPSSAVNVALTGSSSAPAVFSDELINSLPQAGDAKDALLGASSPYNYPYLLDKGTRRYPSSTAAQSSWTSTPLSAPGELLSLIPEGPFVGSVVRDSLNNAYFINGDNKYPINTSEQTNWGVSASTPTLDSSTLDRKTPGQTLDAVFTVGSNTYVMSGGKRLSIGKYKDTYPDFSAPTLSSVGDAPSGGDVSYLASSSGGQTWFINKGKKLSLASFEQKVALGYLSNSVPITVLPDSVLQSIPDSTGTYSNLIQTGSSGIKFLNFGYSLGFPDGQTLIAHTGASGVMSVSPSVFNTFVLRGNVSRLIYDDAGRYYWVENGQKRYINSWSAYQRNGYPSISSVYLQGITMNLIPNGATIQ